MFNLLFSSEIKRTEEIINIAKDIYLILACLKLSRESYNHKQDNLLDLVAYIGALDKQYEDK